MAKEIADRTRRFFKPLTTSSRNAPSWSGGRLYVDDGLARQTVQSRLCCTEDKLFPFKPMQALLLRERVGCTEADRKAWERTGVLAALRPASGTGIHAQYDDANLVTAMIALEIKRMGVPASRYAAAFGELHAWLRNRSSLDWRRYRVFMTPDQVHFHRTGEPVAPTLTGFSLDLGELCTRLFPDRMMTDPQLSLSFALGAVR